MILRQTATVNLLTSPLSGSHRAKQPPKCIASWGRCRLQRLRSVHGAARLRSSQTFFIGGAITRFAVLRHRRVFRILITASLPAHYKPNAPVCSSLPSTTGFAWTGKHVITLTSEAFITSKQLAVYYNYRSVILTHRNSSSYNAVGQSCLETLCVSG